MGITEKEAKKLEDFVCNDCKRGQEAGGGGGAGGGSNEELYCICRTPYDESQYAYKLQDPLSKSGVPKHFYLGGRN